MEECCIVIFEQNKHIRGYILSKLIKNYKPTVFNNNDSKNYGITWK